MDVPYTWKPTGWFQIGWSVDFPPEEVRPLRYFGEDLVAYRAESGQLHVLDAHCPHFGAHIGHGGTVTGECVTCPYHGWVWDGAGTNVAIPYQDKPNRSHRLRSWPIDEQYGCVFMWHSPHQAPPAWPMPDVFLSFPQFETDPAAYYPPHPTFVDKAVGEPVHPQVVAENGPDSVHFRSVHRASVFPVALGWEADGPIWKFLTGWPDARSEDPDAMALKIHSWMFGLGGAISVFEGAQQHRLAFTVTPVDDETSDLFYTVWWPRLPGDDSETPPPELRKQVEDRFMVTMWDDLGIWRHQRYVEHPALAKQDAKPYKALRAWAQQFYEVPADA
jgi:phenylpropionate dioxygenase-like ring-hydroxylating dioxygenase large terminal subunit